MQTTPQIRHKFRHYILAALGLMVLLTVACDGKAKKQAVKPAPPNIVASFDGRIQETKIN